MDRVRIRPIRPSDEGALEAFYAGLSVTSRYSRFLGSARGLDERRARQMSAPDGTHETGFVAEQLDGGSRRIVGHVSLTQSAPDALEIAIAVADGRQHEGIGRRLFRAAIRWAELHDVRWLVATAFTENWRIIHLLRSSRHPAVIRDTGCGLSSVKIYLDVPLQLKPAA